MENFLLGSASSLFATLVIYISRSLWINWWHLLQSNHYPKVAGRYRLSNIFPEGHEYTQVYGNDRFFLDLRQVGKKLTGSFEFFDGDDLKHKFPLTGSVGTDRSIIISYESPDPTYTSKGTMIVRFRGVKTHMDGMHTFICLRCEAIHSLRVEVHKIEKK
ncbi:hypothetical protein NMR73_003878 [Vibrio navarrensis]|nr:hypothetical protein [Vibrio navarrensis]EJL6568270.1 hypothetical protein [Vibrio navarrensis]